MTVIRRFAGILVHPAAVFVLAIAFAGVLRYLDKRGAYLPYTAAVTLTLAAIAYIASRRPIFSLYTAGAVTLLIGIASKVKFDLKGFALHYYDLVFTGGDTSALDFLVRNYGYILYIGLALIGVAVVLLAVVFTADRPRAPRLLWRVGLVPACVGLAILLFPKATPENQGFMPFIDGYNASAFYFSFADFDPMGRKVKLADHLKTDVGESLSGTADCGTGQKPDVMLVLSESQADPAIFPELGLPEDFRALFASDDGMVRPLSVEIFGGGTWATNFSVLTGLSPTDFSWQSHYVTELMENRIRGALPEMLAACGYRTVTIMPMFQQFVNEGDFLRSIGVQEVYDAAALGLAGVGNLTEDSTYYDFAEKLIAKHRATDGRPLFLAIQTMFAHGPYDAAPETRDAGSKPFSDDPQVDNYLRRVHAARLQIHRFLAERQAEPGPRGTVLLEYGDHQPIATKPLLEQRGDLRLADLTSPAYRTFLSIHAFETPVDKHLFDKPMATGFLAATLVEAAGLPSSPLMRSLADLREACGGKYHDCPQRELVDANLTMRANGGLLKLD